MYRFKIGTAIHVYCRDCGKQVLQKKQQREKHLRTKHPDLEIFMPLIITDTIPNGPGAAYINL